MSKIGRDWVIKNRDYWVLVGKFLEAVMLRPIFQKKQPKIRTKNKEQRTKNKEQKTKNKEQRTKNNPKSGQIIISKKVRLFSLHKE